jgi:hypothetical protein
LEAFRMAAAAAAVSKGDDEAGPSLLASSKPTPGRAPAEAGLRTAVVKAPVKPALKPRIQVKPKAATAAAGQQQRKQPGAAAVAAELPAAKRLKPGSSEEAAADAGLGSLLGGYGSDESSD